MSFFEFCSTRMNYHLVKQGLPQPSFYSAQNVQNISASAIKKVLWKERLDTNVMLKWNR